MIISKRKFFLVAGLAMCAMAIASTLTNGQETFSVATILLTAAAGICIFFHLRISGKEDVAELRHKINAIRRSDP